ncbi:MAG TPA: type II toxin-antitoxin system RelE/ParE family toxin [bacterium]|nr:type II toxin-antitoxin system RelE/ParE family toxin [bacterium]HPN45728.1 type II toxin-antitoxin system RelE/ParE family toxin [bacterium]
MREIIFYRTVNGHCPVEEFLDSLNDKQIEKVLWVFKIIKELTMVPKEYFKKLVNTDDLWEIRINAGNKSIRILGFFVKNKFLVLTNAFVKKSQKTPGKEIQIAQQRKKDYLERK